MVKVSVIVPVYGAEAYIAQCARSVLGQTWDNTEFLFVNDGTPDRSMEILREVIGREFPGKDIRILEKANEGAPLARQKGLEAATGDYILYADADDFLEPGMVEKLALAATEADADMAYCAFYKGSRVCRDRLFSSGKEFSRDMLAYRAYGYLWNKLLRRSLFESRYCCPRYGMHDDMVLLCQILPGARKLVRVEDPLYHYRCDNAASISHRGKAARDAESARNFLEMIRFWEGEKEVPFAGSLPLLYARAGWAAYRYDRSLPADYPELAARVLALPSAPEHPLRFWRVKRWLRMAK